MELLGLGRNISIDTSVDEEEVHLDDDTFDMHNGDNDLLERSENVSSPSHSGGITSPDLETESDNSSEVGGTNALQSDDPYRFIASPVSTEIGNKNKKRKTSDTTQPSGSGRDKKCKNCKLKVSAINFKKHIVTHLYDKWPEVGTDSKHCSVCSKTYLHQKYLINHLATVHHQLEEKLAEEGETVESYEMEIEDETEADRSVDTVSNNLLQQMELEPSVLFTQEENDDLNRERHEDDDNDSDSTVPCSPRNCDDSDLD